MEIILFIQKMANGFWDGFFTFITAFGEELVVVAVIAAVYWCLSKPFAFQLTLVYLMSALVNFGLKNIVREPRPEGVRKLYAETAPGYSFPSGHSQSVAVYTAALTQRYLKKHVLAAAGGVLLVLAVMLSRLYLGHHYLHDVIAGAVIGYAIGWFGSLLMSRVRIDTRWYLLLLLPAVLLLVFTTSATVYKAVGGGISLVAGYIIEERLVASGEPKCAAAILERLIVGFAGAAALYFGLTAIPVENRFFDLGIFLLLGVWVSVGAPALFKRFEKLRVFGGKPKEETL